jgi:hypothetical protein
MRQYPQKLPLTSSHERGATLQNDAETLSDPENNEFILPKMRNFMQKCTSVILPSPLFMLYVHV